MHAKMVLNSKMALAKSICGVIRDGGSLGLSEAQAGFGNRLGIMLTAAALGDALNRTILVTPMEHWSSGRYTQGRGVRRYSNDLVGRAVQLPGNMHVLQVRPANQSLSIFGNGYQGWQRAPWWFPPHLPIPYLYVPELSWEWLRIWVHPATFRSTAPTSGVFESKDRRARVKRKVICLERSAYLASYRRVQQQLRPRYNLHNRRPWSYLVLHLRHSRSRADRAEGNVSVSAWSKIEAISRATLLPWLVLSDVQASRDLAELRMLRSPDIFALVSHAPQRESFDFAVPSESELSVGVMAGKQPNQQGHVDGSSLQTVRDFFAIANAAGVAVDVPLGFAQHKWVESSFSTVAAQAGGAPLLTLRSLANCTNWAVGFTQTAYFGCAPSQIPLPKVQGMFASGDVDAFSRAALAHARQ